MLGGDDYIDCETIGECVAVNADGSKFYAGVCVNGLTVKRFDCVRILVEEEDKAGELFSYGQILAVFDDGFGDGVFVEVRWFQKPQELNAMRKKKVAALQNELVECKIIEDIPAGSVIEKIEVLSPAQFDAKAAETTAARPSLANTFVCRFSTSEASGEVLIPVNVSGMNNRAADASEFKDLYNNVDRFGSSFIQSALDEDDGGVEDISSAGKFVVYSKAVRRLHVSVIPGTLPCRTAEKETIMNYLRTGINGGGHIRPLYISGMPGSGKTACFLAALRTLEEENRRDLGSLRKQALELEASPSKRRKTAETAPELAGRSTAAEPTKALAREFQFVEINCLKLHSPQDAYSVLWKGISGERLSSKTALQRLFDYFSIANNRKMFGRDVVTVCLLDELDFLVSGNESVVYNFFDWPQLPNSSFIVVGIANTMDLPERLTNKARSRMGGDQTNRMIFQPYTFDQVHEILLARLGDLGVFEKVNLEVLSRKAVNAAGDLRAALKICQRAIEIHVEEITRKDADTAGGGKVNGDPGAVTPVPMQIVGRAVTEYKENPLMIRTGNCCILEKLILVAMCKHAKITDTGSMTLEEVWDRMCDLINADDRAMKRDCGDSLSRLGNVPTVDPVDILDDAPPYFIFELCVKSMCSQGILVKTEPAAYSRLGSKEPMLCDCMFSTRLMPSDIVAALKKHRLLNYL